MFGRYNVEEPTPEEAAELRKKGRERVERLRAERLERAISKRSPYTEGINRFLQSEEELGLYMSLKLEEKKVTRLALIRFIDYGYEDDYGISNEQRMREGKAPLVPSKVKYLTVHLHHIGQNVDGPFAELTESEHLAPEVYSILHTAPHQSWRNDEEQYASFNRERRRYWKRRVSIRYGE